MTPATPSAPPKRPAPGVRIEDDPRTLVTPYAPSPCPCGGTRERLECVRDGVLAWVERCKGCGTRRVI